MNKNELLRIVSDLISSDKGYLISEEYKIGDYNHEIVGNLILLTIKERNDIRAFRSLIKNNGDKTPAFEGLSYQTSLELLFNHYPYGHTNASNCFLIDENGQVFGVSWNNSNHNSFIKSTHIKYPGYVVINNKKKLEYKFYIEDIEKLSTFFNSLK